MRVVFFLQGERVPAARVRGRAIARALEAAGVTCELRIPHPSVYGDTDLPGPLGWPRPLYSVAAAVARLGQLGGLRRDDVIFFQRPMVELPTTALERLAARGRRVIFDFDDAIYLNRFGAGKLRRLVALADRVIAGNRTLAAAAAAPEKTVVIPTAVDTARFTPALRPADGRRGRDVVVGWTGLASNYRQLATALPGLAAALRRTGARLLLVSNAPPPGAFTELGAEYRPWSPDDEPAALAAMDIGLMPLPDTPYARGKCAFKLLQYMAVGIPGVASPVGANAEVVTDGVDGFLPRDQSAWEEALVRLIEDPGLRAQVGARGRARVESTYSLAAVTPAYLRVLSELGTT